MSPGARLVPADRPRRPRTTPPGSPGRAVRVLFAMPLAAAMWLMAAAPAHAVLEVDITEGVAEPIQLAVTAFHADDRDGPADAALARQGRELADVIAADLERSGLFEVLDRDSYLQSPAQIREPDGVRYQDWRLIEARALVSGRVARASDGRLRVTFDLHDVYGEQRIRGPEGRSNSFTAPQSAWRRVAHIIADRIYARLTGEGGYFDSRIVYVSETGPPNDRTKRLAIMDQDGAGHVYLTDGRHLVLTPRFSPRAQEITYVAYVDDRPRVYLFDIETGRIEILGDFPGMTFAPRFGPAGNQVIMSLAIDGNTDIYSMDLRTRRVTQLTDHPAIDTAPSFAPDGERLVFESARGGSQQLYVMEADGGEVERISYGEGRYGTPVWSPRGDLIAFTKILEGRFYIGVMRPDGSGERLLTSAYHVEGPSWAPNGRVLAYFKEWPVGPRGRQRRSELFTIDLTGQNEQRIPTPEFASDPAWSPLLPTARGSGRARGR